MRCRTKRGQFNRGAVSAEAKLHGKFLLRTSVESLSPEDIALGYKALYEAERGWRDPKSTIDLRPVYHRRANRIESHVQLCWLALLILRVAETETADMRDATPADAQAVAGLLADMGYPAPPEEVADRVAAFAASPASRLQVAETTERGIVGLVATHIVPRLDDDALTCRITDLVVSANQRRAGIGSALMAVAEQEARRAGAPRLDLSCGEWRADAHGFYERHGFETRARAYTKRLSPGP